MQLTDFLGLVYPVLAVFFVFPLVGIVVNYAWATRQRRLQAKSENKNKIPASSGLEHKRLGSWLTGAVVGVILVGVLFPIGKNIITNRVWDKAPFQVIFILFLMWVFLFYLFAINTLFLYYFRFIKIYSE
ncbi:hypothetical protein NIES2101_07255 [Calothrix sp. HK-06]|nr:hypothetical protein NIES2101_07255 [Calothrix sp. HK-06]